MLVKESEAQYVWSRLKTGKIARVLVIAPAAHVALFRWCMTGRCQPAKSEIASTEEGDVVG